MNRHKNNELINYFTYRISAGVGEGDEAKEKGELESHFIASEFQSAK